MIVEVEGLRKSFGSTPVLTGVDFAVPPGTVLGILGPNGAGKTTTVRILTTLLRPDGGSVRIAGHDVVRSPRAVRAAISLTGQSAAVVGSSKKMTRPAGRTCGQPSVSSSPTARPSC